MNANELGKKLGIGVRVAGRIAQQRAAESARTAPGSTPVPGPIPVSLSHFGPGSQEIREIVEKSHRVTRAAGRGVGGFLRPFSRVGGILWLEITGFFFGLFAAWFALGLWRWRLSYAHGPDHQRFLVAAVLTALFSYLSVSAFWRARRR